MGTALAFSSSVNLMSQVTCASSAHIAPRPVQKKRSGSLPSRTQSKQHKTKQINKYEQGGRPTSGFFHLLKRNNRLTSSKLIFLNENLLHVVVCQPTIKQKCSCLERRKVPHFAKRPCKRQASSFAVQGVCKRKPRGQTLPVTLSL